MPAINLAFVLRVLAVWLLMMLVESAQGALRRGLSDPTVEFAARQAGVVVGAAVIFAIAWLAHGWLRLRSVGGALAVGLCWAALTVVFEIGLGRSLGAGWSRIWEDYNLAMGGLMGLGLAAMALTPWAVLRLRGPAGP